MVQESGISGAVCLLKFLRLFVKSYLNENYLLLHGKYRCLGFTTGNFVITGLEWNLGITFPGDHNM